MEEPWKQRSQSMEMISTALFPVSLFLLLLALKFLNSRLRLKKGSREAPGPWNLPFLGSLHHLLGSKLPHRVFRDLSAVYGPVMSLKLGEINAVVLSSAEAAREVMKTHDIAFATRPISVAIDAIFYGGNSIVFGPYGEFWRTMRRICTMELLSAKRVRSFRAVREEEVSHLIRTIAASSGSAVNLSREMAEISNNVMARAVIGSRCGDQNLFFSALGEVVEFVTGLTTVDLFPSLPFIGRITGYHQKLEQCRIKLDEMAENIVQEHLEKITKRSAGGGGGGSGGGGGGDGMLMEEDLTDVLLRIQREGSLPFPLTNDNIKAVINDMLLAGSETTATILEWTMSELILNPNIMKKAQKEVRDALGSINVTKRVAEEEVLSGRLPYLQLVIKEAFRLHPPGPLLLPRENQESYKVMGYEIPAKTTMVINMWAIARDTKYWADPDVFWPERFEESSLDFRGAHFEFTPFGAGRRICPGMQFGLAMVEIILAYLLYYFDWEFLGEKLDMTEAFGTTTRRESPLCIIPTLRFPLPGSA